jgi:hypothetical protein
MIRGNESLISSKPFNRRSTNLLSYTKGEEGVQEKCVIKGEIRKKLKPKVTITLDRLHMRTRYVNVKV